LSITSALAAILLLNWITPLLQEVVRRFTLAGPVRIDGRVLLFTAGVSLLTTVLCSIVPAWQILGRDAARSLAHDERIQSSQGRSQLVLVGGQIALTFVLAVAAGLLLRSFQRLQQVNVGFDTAKLLTFRVTGRRGELPGAVVQRQLRMLDALGAVPGVKAAAIANALPIQSLVHPTIFRLQGAAAVSGSDEVSAQMRMVSADYFTTLGLPVLAGTTCVMEPGLGSWKTLVNRRFVDRFLAGHNPLQQRIVETSISNIETTIIGVVGDAHEDGIERATQPTVYLCGTLPYSPDPAYLVRTDAPDRTAGDIRAAVRRVEPQRAIYAVRTMSDILEDSVAHTRIKSFVVASFATVALVLAAVGLYGVLTQWVYSRRREIGVRLALGATPGRIQREVLSLGTMMIGGGVVVGFLAAFAFSRLMARQLFEVQPTDPLTFAGVAAVLAGVTVAACLFPARRAAYTNPLDVLRQD
jgi:putative ABC transport system permease protein